MKNIKMYILDNGFLSLDKVNMVAGNNMATTENKHPTADWIDIPVMTNLIVHPEGLILFDTACDPKGMSENWPEMSKKVSPYEVPVGGTLPERLEQLNIRPEDVKYVVMSHLHTDHSGCLGLFKNAEVFVNDFEFTQSLKVYATREDRPAYSFSDIKAFIDAGLNWHTIDNSVKEYKLLDGVTILNFGPGHTFGMMGLMVELENSGNFILCADALYTSDNFGPPMRFPGMMYDTLGYAATWRFITDYAKCHNAKVIFGHDKAQFDGLKKSTEGYYD
jgi:N-acyl homoserine lactone hydrolase